MVPESVKKIVTDSDTLLWGVTFVGICILVGLGKLKSETIEYMMMAVVGRASVSVKKDQK